MRGGERCLEVLCELFPEAHLYTLLHVEGSVSATIERMRIRTSFIQRLPSAASRYRYYLPLFPRAIERFDLTGYDLVISSSHCVAKGVRIPNGVCHLAYVYTPMRYVWDQYEAYFGKGRAGWLTRWAMTLMRHRLQRWDVASSKGVYAFLAISRHVADRISRHYGRAAEVIYPPVDCGAFSLSTGHQGFYLMVTAFAPYKRVDLAIAAFNAMGKPLKIIGTGQEERKLRAQAGPTIEFLGWQPDPVVREAYAQCRALIFPGEEDFGIVPLEAMACGKPVIAYGKGGVLETVVPLNPKKTSNGVSGSVDRGPPTGVFFYEQRAEALIEAVRFFEQHESAFDPQAIRAHVLPFDRTQFKARLSEVLDRLYHDFRKAHSC
jgi:glycosyltransferase involved in cell wall biosynthesis